MVTVWRIALDPARGPSVEPIAELSDAERARATLFVSDALRNRWLHGHVATRRILARELGVAPEAVVYGAAAAGKPFVAAPAGSGVEFSYSDSGDLALVAVGSPDADPKSGDPTVGALGVDVEAYRPMSDMDGIAKRFFAEEEREALFALPETERVAGFYRLWTRKEAYIKAIGTGLGHALDRFAVTIGMQDVRILHDGNDRSVAARLALHAVPVGEGYEAALVAPRASGAPVIADWDRR
jgi:4'-phosphopantetheinyl transferase